MGERANPKKVAVELCEDGQIQIVRLDAPKANVLDAQMVAELTAVVAEARKAPGLKAIVFEGAGAHFSFGASVEEHAPGRVAAMLDGFHTLFEELADLGVFLLAAVRGQCLGGGLELAAFCQRVVAAPDAQLGQPEIRLGVIAPVASVILPARIGQGAADDLCCTGRSIDATEAHRIGLVDELADDPHEAAVAYAVRHLVPLSASSLRHAVQGARRAFHGKLAERIREMERTYLEDLMATEDAVEGIQAFLEKRPPEWRDR